MLGVIATAGCGAPVPQYTFRTPVLEPLDEVDSECTEARLSSDGARLLCKEDREWNYELFSITKGKVSEDPILAIGGPTYFKVAFSPKLDRAVTCTIEKGIVAVELWALDPSASGPRSLGQSKEEIDGSVSACEESAFSADGQYAITHVAGRLKGSFEGDWSQIRLWQVPASSDPGLKPAAEAVFEKNSYAFMEPSPDGRWLAIPKRDGAALFHVTSDGGRLQLERKGTINCAERMTFAPDGSYLVAACGADVHLWKLSAEAGAVHVAGLGPPARIRSQITFYPAPAMTISPDGKWMIATSLRLWVFRIDVEGSAPFVQVAAPVGHGGGVSSATFSSDSTRLLTGASDRAAELWSLDAGTSTATPIATMPGHDGTVSKTYFLPSGDALTASLDGDAKLWKLPSP